MTGSIVEENQNAAKAFDYWMYIHKGTQHNYVGTGYPKTLFSEKDAENLLLDEDMLLTYRLYIAEYIIISEYKYMFAKEWLLSRQYGLALIRAINLLQPLHKSDLFTIAHNPNLFSPEDRGDNTRPIIVATSRVITHKPVMELTTIDLMFYRKALDFGQLGELIRLLLSAKLITTYWAGRLLELCQRASHFDQVANQLANFLRSEYDLPDDLPDDWVANLT